MSEREALAALVAALDAYIDARGRGEQAERMNTFNALLRSAQHAKRVLAQTETSVGECCRPGEPRCFRCQ